MEKIIVMIILIVVEFTINNDKNHKKYNYNRLQNVAFMQLQKLNHSKLSP